MTRSLTGLPVAVCIFSLATAASLPSAVASTSETLTASTSEAHPASFESNATRSLTFAERIAAERAIQGVYWQHRIWPSQNPGPKPSLDKVMSASAIRAKVEDYLKKSSALETLWSRPITADQLQAEIDRMTRATRQPGVLRELFQALDNDPVRIAECLARPSLVDRQVHDRYARDRRFHDAVRQKAEAALTQNGIVERMARLGGEYRVTRWKRGGNDGDEQRPSDPAPGSVHLDSMGWNRLLERLRSRLAGGRFQDSIPIDTETGIGVQPELAEQAELGLQSGLDAEPNFDTGVGLATQPLGQTPSPSTPAQIELPLKTLTPLQEDDGSFSVTAVLEQEDDELTTATVSWRKRPFDEWWRGESRSIPADLAMPAARYSLSLPNLDVCTNDTWRPTRMLPAPDARIQHTAVWTGSEMLIWGGSNAGFDLYHYNPSTDTWTVTTDTPPGATGTDRSRHTAVWTGTRMIVWGGAANGSAMNTGWLYDPMTNTWTATSTGANVPSARLDATAVWTGSVMVIWGGAFGSTYLATGGRYNPGTNSWLPTANTGASTGRAGHTAVWTGSEMVVWGGEGKVSNCACSNDASLGCTTNTQCRFCNNDHTVPCTANSNCTAVGGICGSQGTCVGSGCTFTIARLNTGGRYSPTTNTWTATGTGTDTPSARKTHTAVWTGSEMVVWGGTNGTSVLQTGSRYNPTSNTWVALSSSGGVPPARSGHTAVWTGTEMIVWGGTDGTSPLGTGGRYVPSSDTWSATSTTGDAPSARTSHTAIWTGSEMIVWGGQGTVQEDTGGRYSPASDSWVATPTEFPPYRVGHSAIWTGSEMIVYGGGELSDPGQRYDPATDSWTYINSSSDSTQDRYEATAVWTGTEMIVWAGESLSTDELLQTGGRYDPLNDSWTPTSTTGAPSPRDRHVGFWMGTEMIIWGGTDGHVLGTGSRYDPSNDSWTPTSMTGAPSARVRFDGVWTGSEMIVWGGYDGVVPPSGYTKTGGRYDPSSDSWTPTSTGPHVPTARGYHVAVWTGSRMIVWGGYDDTTGYVSSGGRYDPSNDAWAPTSTGAGVPPGEAISSAVWTGNEMIVWGGVGEPQGNVVNTGGRYNPVGDFWDPTSTGANVPSERWYHTAVATGSEMIVFGGYVNTGGLYCYACALTTWYRDADGDGYGDPSLPVSSCDQHPGWVASSGDCNDANGAIHPGAVEICDGFDNDCNGTVDDAAPPSAVPALSVGEPAIGTAHLVWGAVPSASAYDIVRGSLVALHTSGGDFSVATDVCLENDFAATTRDDADLPGAGQGFWYLIRAGNCGGAASYDEGVPSQVGSRDAEMQASGYACP